MSDEHLLEYNRAPRPVTHEELEKLADSLRRVSDVKGPPATGQAVPYATHAGDAEPPIGSTVEDRDGDEWLRLPVGWVEQPGSDYETAGDLAQHYGMEDDGGRYVMVIRHGWDGKAPQAAPAEPEVIWVTPDDPEPGYGAVVVDRDGDAWVHGNEGWTAYSPGGTRMHHDDLADLFVYGLGGRLRLLHEGRPNA